MRKNVKVPPAVPVEKKKLKLTLEDFPIVYGINEAIKQYRTAILRKMKQDYTYKSGTKTLTTQLYENKGTGAKVYKTLTFKYKPFTEIVVDTGTGYIIAFKLKKHSEHKWYKYHGEDTAAIAAHLNVKVSEIYAGEEANYGSITTMHTMDTKDIDRAIEYFAPNTSDDKYFYIYPLLIAEPARNEELRTRMIQALMVGKKIDLKRVAEIGQSWNNGMADAVSSPKANNPQKPKKAVINIKAAKKAPVKAAPPTKDKQSLNPAAHKKCLAAFDTLAVK